MFDIFLDKIKKIFLSRLFPIALIYLVLFSVIVNKLFVLQIVQGPTHTEDSQYKRVRSREIKSTRGNIYDRKGKLLASNVLTYSVTLEDTTSNDTNKKRNEVIYRLIKIIEKNGDTLDNEFGIKLDENGKFEFTLEGSALTRFKKNAFSWVLEDNQMTKEQENATAEEVFQFLRYGKEKHTDMFGISDDYTLEEALKIMGVRYALFSNYPKYVQITVASNIKDTTVAAVLENSAKLSGVEIQQQTHRYYHDSLYFSHILGYTGLVSAEELEKLDAESDYYNSTDVIGKLGLEKEYENYLGGTKGSEIVTINSLGKVVEVTQRTEPTAGSDVYLTIDSELQKNIYHIIEQRIAGILLQKIQPNMNYGSRGESAADILIPIYEVYNALINNNIIDINHFSSEDAKDLERSVYQKYQSNLSDILNQLDSLLSMDNSITNNRALTMKEYLDYFYNVLVDKKILLRNEIPKDNPNFVDYQSDKIPLSYFLQQAIANNWIDLGKLNIGNSYYSSEELYYRLITYTKNMLLTDSKFQKMIYRNLIFSYKLSGTEISLLLFDQGVLEYNEDDVRRLKNGSLSAYTFITDKLRTLEITPAMLALEPCSGSVVVTDVNTGDVLALVTYPSYDNNKFANKIDAKYYEKLRNDNSLPMLNKATQQAIAPGSTFKMVTSIAALEENLTTPSERIRDLGIFEKINQGPRCHIYPGSHGAVDLADALKVSCNYYYYEMGWRLSLEGGKYNKKYGIDRLTKYASMLGLDAKSGVEIFETSPHVSTEDPIRSAIGQGSNAYTPVQLSRYITTIANRGTSYNLTLLDKVKDSNNTVILDNKAEVYHSLTDVKPTTWDAVQAGLYAVVNVQGGSSVNLYRNLGVTVAGKTGTSQISKVNLNNALFVSYAPYETPEISVTAVIPNGNTSSNAAEIARDVYKIYFNLEKDTEIVNGEVKLPENNIANFVD